MIKEPLKIMPLLGIISVYNDASYFQQFSNNKLLSRKPMTKKSLKTIFKFLNSENDFSGYKFKGIIPKNVISINTDSGDIAFTTNIQRRKMIFKNSFKTTEYNIPKLLWVFKNNSLSVFALKSDIKSNENYLFQAPFLNVGSTGSVCMGNTKFENNFEYFEDFMEYLQNQFFDSVFTHTNTDILAKENLYDVYEKAQNVNFQWNNYLVKLKLKVKDVLH